MRKYGLLMLVLLVTGCNFGFLPETLVADLRVLGVTAEPPDVNPGTTTQVSALVLDPLFPSPTVLWLGCAPDPFDLNRSACSDATTLADPSALVSGGTLPAGVNFLGVGDLADYPTDAHLFDALDAGDSRRQTGTVGQVIAFAVADQVPIPPSQDDLTKLFNEVKNQQVQSLITLFRIPISERTALNHNPHMGQLIIANELVPRGAHFQVIPHFQAQLDLTTEDDDFEAYTETTPTSTEQLTEKLLVAWYSSSGRFDTDRVTLRTDVKSVFTAPGSGDETDPVPTRREQTLWAVVRDTRGGQAWAAYPFYVCDPSLPAPKLSAIASPSNRSDPVRVTGEHLENLLDVVVGGEGLSDGAYSASAGNWEGFIPADLPAGTYPVHVLGKDGSRCDSVLTVIVP